MPNAEHLSLGVDPLTLDTPRGAATERNHWVNRKVGHGEVPHNSVVEVHPHSREIGLPWALSFHNDFSPVYGGLRVDYLVRGQVYQRSDEVTVIHGETDGHSHNDRDFFEDIETPRLLARLKAAILVGQQVLTNPPTQE